MDFLFDNERKIYDAFKDTLRLNFKSSDENDFLTMFERIKSKTEKINETIENNYTDKMTILMAGYVQSGKTTNFISLISKRLDYDCNFCIVFCGVTNELYSQNSKRLEQYFTSEDDLCVKNNISFHKLNKGTDFEEIKNDLANGKKIVIAMLKNHSTINKLAERVSKFKHLLKKPMIVDDEGDQHSFSNIHSIYKNERNSTTYEKIKKLLESMDKYLYVTVTATPYASIVAPYTYLGESNFLKPDYAFTIEAGKNYFGISDFLSGNEQSPILEMIDEDDNELQQMFDEHVICDSLKKSLCYFLFNGLVFHNKISKTKQSASMLIHVHTNNNENIAISEIIQNYVHVKMKAKLKKLDSDESKWIQEAIDEYNSNMKNENEKTSYEHFINAYNKKELWNQFDIQVIIGNNKMRSPNKIYNILIGSKKLDRGNTINNLIISYVSKRNKTEGSMDTILQMCRWFGYREKYKYLLKVWLTNVLMNDYISIAEADVKVMDKIVDGEMEKFNFQRSLYIPQHDYGVLKGTRATVAKQNIYEISNKYIYDNRFVENVRYQEINRDTKLFFDKVVNKIKEYEIDLKTISDNLDRYPSTEFNTFSDFKESFGKFNIKSVLKGLYSENNFIDVELFYNFLEKKYKDKKVVLSIMTKNINSSIENLEPRERTYCKSTNRILALEKGRNYNGYVGDKYWFKVNPDILFIQIHKIALKSNNEILELNTGNPNDKYIYKILISANDVIYRNV